MKRIVSYLCYSFLSGLFLLGGNSAMAAPAAPTLTSLAENAYLNENWQTAAGACQARATVTVSGDVTSAKSVRCISGRYSMSINLLNGNGAKTLRVIQRDRSGRSPAISRTVNLDKTAPAAPVVISPSNGSTLSNQNLIVSGNCESSAVVSLGGDIESAPKTAMCNNSNYSISASLTSGIGSKVLSISQRDRAGNISSVSSLSLTLSGGTTDPDPGGGGTTDPDPGGGGTTDPDPQGFQTIFDCSVSNFVIATSNSRVPCAVAGPAGWVSPIGFAIPGSPVSESSVENGRVYLSRDYDNGGHLGTNMIYQTPVNTRAFEATFTFIPSGKNIAFVMQNATNSTSGFNGSGFDSGAGCEAGFFQAYGSEGAVNNIFALALMQDMPLLSVNDSWANDYFTHSSAMIYKTGESPCSYMPTPHWANSTPFSIPTKISTSPVSLNGPANVPLTSTGQNYEAKITYDGSKVTLNLRNLTTGGTCPGANCFTHTWNNVNIPALVGGNTAWVSISAGCNSDCARRVNINSFKYAVPAN